jgi:hypothetical protein
MSAGAVHAAPASIPKPLVVSGPPSVPVEGGPEKLLTEYNYIATHFNCGRKTGFWLVVIPVALTAILAIVIAIVLAQPAPSASSTPRSTSDASAFFF